MTPRTSLVSSTSEPKRFQKRLAVLLVGSVLLHFIVFDWATDNILLPSRAPAEPDIINVHLDVIDVPSAMPALPAAQPVQKKAAIVKKHPIVHPALTAMHSEDNPAATEAPEPPPPAGMETPGTSTETVTELAAPAIMSAADNSHADTSAIDAKGAQPPLTGQHYTVNPPSSAVLKYNATRVLKDGEITHGNGLIDWQSDGKNYRIRGEIGILFFTLLNFKSEGLIDEWGISPVMYSERRFRKSETNTHFHRERNTISFSASTTTYPRTGGEQDRGSIVWQLAGIGRGDGEKFIPGAEIDLFVAGVRDGEIWRIQVIGQEEIEVGLGKTKAWHVSRQPRPGSYEQKLDIWLAPQQQWYPVKLRYTETNSDYVELSLSDIKPATAN